MRSSLLGMFLLLATLGAGLVLLSPGSANSQSLGDDEVAKLKAQVAELQARLEEMTAKASAMEEDAKTRNAVLVDYPLVDEAALQQEAAARQQAEAILAVQAQAAAAADRQAIAARQLEKFARDRVAQAAVVERAAENNAEDEDVAAESESSKHLMRVVQEMETRLEAIENERYSRTRNIERIQRLIERLDAVGLTDEARTLESLADAVSAAMLRGLKQYKTRSVLLGDLAAADAQSNDDSAPITASVQIGDQAAGQQDLIRLLDELRQEVRGLREEVGGLRKAIEQRPDATNEGAQSGYPSGAAPDTATLDEKREIESVISISNLNEVVHQAELDGNRDVELLVSSLGRALDVVNNTQPQRIVIELHRAEGSQPAKYHVVVTSEADFDIVQNVIKALQATGQDLSAAEIEVELETAVERTSPPDLNVEVIEKKTTDAQP